MPRASSHRAPSAGAHAIDAGPGATRRAEVRLSLRLRPSGVRRATEAAVAALGACVAVPWRLHVAVFGAVARFAVMKLRESAGGTHGSRWEQAFKERRSWISGL